MNKAVLIGRLTKDPELRYTPANNTPVCSFTLAVDRRKRDDGADFIPVVAWGKQAELCSKHLTKGSQVGVAGRIQVRTFDNREGKKQYATEIILEELTFCDSRRSGSAPAPPDDYNPDADDPLPF